MDCLPQRKGEYIPSVLGGVNIGRDSDTIAAMNGAMAGALHGADAVPKAWQDRINIIRGRCVLAMKGIDVRDIAKDLTNVLIGGKE